ncbi:hypothetical protein BN890_12490 [Bacteroides xylanisolvens SD CC 1b]|uniref:Uncharacterized protein n=1 Tax=Bacteroides xylanisolvens SD CC 1b TaxID=702447 RepID=D4VL48_9BACE|nr:hypothetical protein CW3_0794 [Bacteroides xylanisolvens SD CC 1b]CDL98023.1 hypothetical protein BN891_9140 [Bacteroides xylanisolvens SD CC 2a]CDM03682.1 hypothetical protein BN890_12490 [Bacteroides xylanisolvens SD CC 1b]
MVKGTYTDNQLVMEEDITISYKFIVIGDGGTIIKTQV